MRINVNAMPWSIGTAQHLINTKYYRTSHLVVLTSVSKLQNMMFNGLSTYKQINTHFCIQNKKKILNFFFFNRWLLCRQRRQFCRLNSVLTNQKERNFDLSISHLLCGPNLNKFEFQLKMNTTHSNCEIEENNYLKSNK